MILQMLQEALGDSDDEAADGPSSDEKPAAGRRSKKAKRDEDSDFEVGGQWGSVTRTSAERRTGLQGVRRLRPMPFHCWLT